MSKFKRSVMHYGKNNEHHKYYMDTNQEYELKSTTSEKDIGVTFTNDLKFSEHIKNITSKANQVIGIIRRCFTHMDNEMFLKLYKSVVRPHLEYGNIIWHPLYKYQIKTIENVQRRATKLVPKLQNLSYEERLQCLGLPSIEYRQLRGDLIQCYKIINKLDNIEFNNFFEMSKVKSTRNSDFKLQRCFARSNIRANFFSVRVVNHWNNLTTLTRSSRDLLTFKINIDRELHYLKYVFTN